MEKSLLNDILNYCLYCSQEKEYAEAIDDIRNGNRKKQSISKPVKRAYSHVEKQSIEICNLQQKKAAAAKRKARIAALIEESGLTEQEKQVLWCMAYNIRLARYAKENDIKISKVYKIRDRALRKIIKSQKNSSFTTKTG